MTRITEEMVNAGREVAGDLITANICKSMNGLGGGKTWEEFKATCKHLALCEQYINAEIDSVTAIYLAMVQAETVDLEPVAYLEPNGVWYSYQDTAPTRTEVFDKSQLQQAYAQGFEEGRSSAVRNLEEKS